MEIRRARDFSDIVRESYEILKANYVRLIIVAAIAEGLWFAIGISIIVLVPAVNDPGLFGIVETVAAFAVAFLVFYPISLAMFGALIHATAEQYSRPISIIRAYRRIIRNMGRLLVTAVVASVAVSAMFITIIGIPFAIFFGNRWLFVLHAVILEDKGWREAFSRSSALVKGMWWRVFGIYVALAMIAGGLTGLLGITLGFIPWIGAFLVVILTAPVLAVASTVFYYDMVSRKDGCVMVDRSGAIGSISS